MEGEARRGEVEEVSRLQQLACAGKQSEERLAERGQGDSQIDREEWAQECVVSSFRVADRRW